MARPNLDAVAAFATFAESLNFSEAARQLHISQPALHVKIRRLGEQLGFPLYRRAGRALQLTQHGERVARFGREFAARTREMTESLARGVDRERIALAAGEGAYLYLLGGGIQRFVNADVADLGLLTRDGDGAIEAVRSGRADLGVAPLDTVPDDLDATLLTRVGQVLVVHSGHPLARRSRLRITDLEGLALVVPPPDRPHRRLLAQLLQSRDVSWRVAVEASGWELMLRFVQMGVGAAVVNACCAIPRGLRAIPIPEWPTLRFHMFRLARARVSPARERLEADLRRHADDWSQRRR